MGLNATPSGERIQIGLFGKRNVGKSSLFNGIANQELAIVSEQLGTTTDPVKKAMEILPIGPVVLWDTPGMDDEGMLGEKRVEKTKQALEKIDVAILVVDVVEGLQTVDYQWLDMVKERKLPHLVVFNKSDLTYSEGIAEQRKQIENSVVVSANNKGDMQRLRECIACLTVGVEEPEQMLKDMVKPMQQVLLVVPIDESAPKGRLILPQQMVIRELLEIGAVTLVVKETELEKTLNETGINPDLVITDSQAFEYVSKVVPEEIALTSFSILMARKKKYLQTAVKGVWEINKLKDGDCVLISEGCTHHRQCKDIGTVKLPAWLESFTGKKLQLEFTSGGEFPEDLSKYQLVIHCGGCMLNEREVMARMKSARAQGVAFTNYGTAIAYMNGILERSIACIPEFCYNH